jgi:hypothetical protein
MFVALMLVVLVGFAALGIDVAYMYSVRHELQRCADSGALAGASAFKEGLTATDAEIRANIYASSDKVAGGVGVPTPLDPLTEIFVTFPPPTSPPPDILVRVDTRRIVNLFFARIWQPSQPISAYATAGYIPPSVPSNPTPDCVLRLVE